MAKVVNDDFLFQIEKINGEYHYSAHYMVSSDGITERRGMQLTFTPAQETQINNFLMSVVRPLVLAQES